MISSSNKLLWTLLLALPGLLAPAGRAACTYSLSTTSRNHGYGAASNVVSLATSNSCAWSVVNSNEWITFTTPDSGFGSFTNIYLVAANPNPSWRTGVVLIAGQTFTVRQNPIPCSYALSPVTRTHGYAFTTGTVNVATATGCAWTLTNANNWITILSNASSSGSNTVTYTVADNTSSAWRTGLVFIADQTYTVIQRAAPCLYEVSPATRVISQSSASGLIDVNATTGCTWNTSNTNNWISISSGASGTGDGSVIYSASANPSSVARTGFVMIADQFFTLSQLGLPCTVSVSPASQAYATAGGSGNLAVSATPGCNWSAINTNGWITFTSPSSGTGTGTVAYSVALNAGFARTGVVVIASQTFTVTQPGLGCTFKLSATNRVHGYAAVTNTVNVTTSNTCPWDVINTNGWITITSGASGSGSNVVGYALDPNATPGDRTGVVLIGGQTLTITQHGVICAYSISPDSRTHGFGAASNYVNVFTSSGCPWTAQAGSSWVTIAAGASGTGNGTVGYTITSNPDSVERVAIVTIGDQSLILTQRASSCSYSIATTEATHGFTAETGLVAVTAIGGCPWTALNTNGWISLLSSNGTGNGTVSYVLATNTGANPRSGTLLIAGDLFTVTQSGMFCSYKLSPTNRTHGSGAAANTIGVTAATGCAWNVTNTNGWITITSPLSGSGSASVNYSVDPNPTPSDRMGVLVIGGQPFMITQRGVGCNVSLSPVSRNHGYGSANNTFTVSTGTNCPWTATSTAEWLTLTLNASGVGGATVSYTVSANPSSIPRTGSVLVADQTLTISQNGAPCNYSILPVSRSHSAGVETGVVSVTTISSCSWAVSNANDWISITSGTNGLGGGTVTYGVAANSTMNSRTGQVQIADDLFTVTQAGLPATCSYRLSPTDRTHGAGATANSVNLITDGGCEWMVFSLSDWITITSPSEGISSTTVNYTIEPNPNLDDRMGVILIGDQAFYITQRGISCDYSLSPANRTHGFSAATNSINVNANIGCAWTVINSNPWINIVSGASGNGNGTFTYTVPGNFTLMQRTGVIMVADQTLTMVQRAATNFIIENIVMQSAGQSKLRLAGAPAGVWRIQGSSNLANWVNVCDVTNVTGVVECIDPAATNATYRFYRAVQP